VTGTIQLQALTVLLNPPKGKALLVLPDRPNSIFSSNDGKPWR